MSRKILCPVDFSANSEHAFRKALSLAAALGASVQVVHAFEPIEVRPDPGFFLYAGNPRPLDAIARDRATRSLQEFQEAQQNAEISVDYRLLEGHPVERIIEEAQSGEYELIVMGTRGRTGLSHLLLGSVAERVVRLAPIPVLTIKLPNEPANPAG